MISLTDITNSPAASQLVDPRYLDAAADSLSAHSKLLRSLIAQKRMPDRGTPVAVIEALLGQLALMDSNNFPHHFGAGEREGRVFSSIVARRHFNMSHGIGRSGDVTADQPKAAGSSLMSKLTNAMARDALHSVGLAAVEKSIVVPMCTGMTLALVLQYVRAQRPNPAQARYVVWPRIDQKTCLKCIEAAGMEPVVVELRRSSSSTHKSTEDEGGAAAAAAAAASSSPGQQPLCLRIHPDDVSAAIEKIGAENIACVLSTTSCFAPRVPDDPLQLARVCATHGGGIPLVVNNAYGVQSPAICRRLNAAFAECGKKLNGLLACVQSCDKNFLVPVGGSVLGGSSAFVDRVAALYAGRASADPTTDLFVTLLEMGKAGWAAVQQDRLKLMPVFKAKVAEFAACRGEGIVDHEANDISFAMTLKNFTRPSSSSKKKADDDNGASAAAAAAAVVPNATTWLGGALFRSGISGPRVLEPPSSAETTKTAKVGKTSFKNYGMHGLDHEAPPMLVLACAVGMTMEDVDGVLKRLETLYPAPTTVEKKEGSR